MTVIGKPVAVAKVLPQFGELKNSPPTQCFLWATGLLGDMVSRPLPCPPYLLEHAGVGKPRILLCNVEQRI
jgi:hypothetical protein